MGTSFCAWLQTELLQALLQRVLIITGDGPFVRIFHFSLASRSQCSSAVNGRSSLLAESPRILSGYGWISKWLRCTDQEKLNLSTRRGWAHCTLNLLMRLTKAFSSKALICLFFINYSELCLCYRFYSAPLLLLRSSLHFASVSDELAPDLGCCFPPLSVFLAYQILFVAPLNVLSVGQLACVLQRPFKKPV